MSSSESEPDRLEETLDSHTLDSSGRRKLWSKQEDERLRLLISYWGDQGGRRSNWDKIAANFSNRSAKSCRKRWFHSLDPKLRRGRWNKTEDKILKESYDRLGPAWQRIAQLIPGRTDDQCAKRYNDVVSPDVQDRLRPWEPEEDEKLLAMHAKYGSKWQTIAGEMSRRTGLTCRNRWRKLTRPSKPLPSSNVEADTHRTNGEAGLDINGTSLHDIRMMNAPPSNLDSQDPILPFDIPGSNQVAGFPAGADANWLMNSNSSAFGQQLPIQSTQNAALARHYTITIDDPTNPPQNAFQQAHHAISELQLNRIFELAAKNGQNVAIHQHIYQVPSTGDSIDTGASLDGEMLPNHSSMVNMSDSGYPSRLMQAKHQSHLLRSVHPPVQPPERPILRSILSNEPYGRRSHLNGLPQPPPDEFLSKPLLFDESGDNSIMPLDTEEVDLLAFNPS